MQIRQRRGRLSYGSAFKLFFVGWFFGWALLIIPLVLVLVIIAAVGGTDIIVGTVERSALTVSPAADGVQRII